MTNEIVETSNIIVSKLIDNYKINGEPIDVNFRELVHWLPQNGRATHFLHPYTAKLLMHIPNLFLSNNILSERKDLILDPFCGSGTVLLEANLCDRNAIGIDVNPLATLIAKVKTTNYSIQELKKYLALFERINDRNINKPDVVNIDYWYSPKSISTLSKLWKQINEIDNNNIRDFFKVSFSICARKFSYADPSVSVPVKVNLNKNNQLYIKKAKAHLEFIKKTDVLEYFLNISKQNIELFKTIESSVFKSKVICSDNKSSDISNLPKVDFVITSPPYAGAQKYVRASSLNLGWLELVPSNMLVNLERKNIGREHYHKNEYMQFHPTGLYEADNQLSRIFEKYPLRAHIASNYINEMRSSLLNVKRCLKKGGYFVLVIGNNVVCGEDFNTQNYIEKILIELNFKTIFKLFDTIKSRGLMTKRNKTANMITREWVILLQNMSEYEQ